MGASVHVCLAPAGGDPRAEARALLLALAGTLVDNPTLTHEETGRPVVPGLAVNISYTVGTVAVAASYDGPLGIDLEEFHPRDVAPLANRWFTHQELRWMEEQPDELTAFLHLWTAKEAVGKARGLGLTNAVLRHPMPLRPPAPHETKPAGATETRHQTAAAPPDHLTPDATPHHPNADTRPGRLHADPAPDPLYGDVVSGEGRLAVLHLVMDHPPQAGVRGPASGWGAGRRVVLAVATGADMSEVVVHRAGFVGPATRFPVVVRGN